MKKFQPKHPPRFLTHHILLRPDCLARMTLPAYLTQRDANRISAMLDALVMEDDDDDRSWPFDTEEDPDGDLNVDEIDASADLLDDEDDFEFLDDDVDENRQAIDPINVSATAINKV